MKKLSRRDVEIQFRVGKYLEPGVITWITDPQTNLITDWGLQALSNWYFADMTRYCMLGTSSQSNKRLIRMSQTENVVTGTSFSIDDETNNRLIIHHNGVRARVVKYTSPTSVLVDTVNTVPAGFGHLCHVDDHTLTVPVLVSNISVLDSGAISNVKTFDPVTGLVTITNTRAILFDPLEEARVFQEIGWGPTLNDGANSNLFGKRIIPLSFDSGDIPYVQISIVRKVDCAPKSEVSVPFYGYEGTSTVKLPYSPTIIDERYYSTIGSTGETIPPTITTMLECVDTQEKVAIFTNLDGVEDEFNTTTRLPIPLASDSIEDIRPLSISVGHISPIAKICALRENGTIQFFLTNPLVGSPVIGEVPSPVGTFIGYTQFTSGAKIHPQVQGGELWALNASNILQYMQVHLAPFTFTNYAPITGAQKRLVGFRGKDIVSLSVNGLQVNSVTNSTTVASLTFSGTYAADITASTNELLLAILSVKTDGTWVDLYSRNDSTGVFTLLHSEHVSTEVVNTTARIYRVFHVETNHYSFYIDELHLLLTWSSSQFQYTTLSIEPPFALESDSVATPIGVFVPSTQLFYATDGISINPYLMAPNKTLPFFGYSSEGTLIKYSYGYGSSTNAAINQISSFLPIGAIGYLLPDKVTKYTYPFQSSSGIKTEVEAGYADDQYLIIVGRELDNLVINICNRTTPTQYVAITVNAPVTSALGVFRYYSVVKMSSTRYAIASANGVIILDQNATTKVWRVSPYTKRVYASGMAAKVHGGIVVKSTTELFYHRDNGVALLTYNPTTNVISSSNGFPTIAPHWTDEVPLCNKLHYDSDRDCLYVVNRSFLTWYQPKDTGWTFSNLYSNNIAFSTADEIRDMTVSGDTLCVLVCKAATYKRPDEVYIYRISDVVPGVPVTGRETVVNVAYLEKYALANPVEVDLQSLMVPGTEGGIAIWRPGAVGVYEYSGNVYGTYRKLYHSSLASTHGIYKGENCYVSVLSNGITVITPKASLPGVIEYSSNIDLRAARLNGISEIDTIFVGGVDTPYPNSVDIEVLLNTPIQTINRLLTNFSVIVKWLQN